MFGIKTSFCLLYLVLAWVEQIASQSIDGVTETPTNRIVGGQIVQHRSEFAFQVSLRTVAGNSPFCGASIIDHRNLLTAAHCVVSDGRVLRPSSIRAVVGDLNTDTISPTTIMRVIRGIFVHERYNPANVHNDIAVLRIDPITFNMNIYSIPISHHLPAPNTNCTISGWGAISQGGPPSTALRFAIVRIISINACRASYGTMILHGMFCAGYYNRDSCQGDSGGPLVCHGSQAGIVSWGYGCGHPDFPGVYTDVAAYFTWIQTQQERSNSNTLIINKYVIVFCLIKFILSKTVL